MTTTEKTTQPHYYGDLIRKQLFLAAFVIMAAALYDTELQSLYLFVGLFGVVAFTVLAGLTSRNNRAILVIEVLVSAVMFLIFEYFAIAEFTRYQSLSDSAFFFRELIAIIFLTTLYYSTKTTRYHETCLINKEELN